MCSSGYAMAGSKLATVTDKRRVYGFRSRWATIDVLGLGEYMRAKNDLVIPLLAAGAGLAVLLLLGFIFAEKLSSRPEKPAESVGGTMPMPGAAARPDVVPLASGGGAGQLLNVQSADSAQGTPSGQLQGQPATPVQPTANGSGPTLGGLQGEQHAYLGN